MGSFAFMAEITPRLTDTGLASEHVAMSKMVEYVGEAVAAYGHKLRTEYKLTFQNDVEIKLQIDVLGAIRVKAPSGEPVPVAVSLRCSRMGNSSYDIEGELRQGDQPVARFVDTFVMVSRETGRSEPIDPAMRQAAIDDHAKYGLKILS